MFHAVLWSPVRKGLTSWLSCVLCFLVFCHLPKCVLVPIGIKGRLVPWDWFKHSSKIFYGQSQGGTSDHLCYLCLVNCMILHLFIAALWSPAGKGLTTWLLFVMFIVDLLLVR